MTKPITINLFFDIAISRPSPYLIVNIVHRNGRKDHYLLLNLTVLGRHCYNFFLQNREYAFVRC